MNLAHLHLLLNHLPILGTLIALGMFVVSFFGDHDDLKQASLGLFALVALMSIPAYLSGNAAADMIKETPGVSETWIQAHQGSALMAFTLMEITGVLALMGLWRFTKAGEFLAKNPWQSKFSRWNPAAVLVSAVLTMALMAITGTTGGDIRHPEITTLDEAPPAISSVGAAVVSKLQYFVIDTSMWVWPILEDVHFVGLIFLLATVGALNLRIMGFLKPLPVAPLHRFLPLGIAGFAMNVVTGFLFYIGMPGFYAVNFVFQIKIMTILVAGANLLLFYCSGAFRDLSLLGPGEDAPLSAKVIAAGSLFLWIAVIILGRYIPFGEVT